jgi:hypothetical protein
VNIEQSSEGFISYLLTSYVCCDISLPSADKNWNIRLDFSAFASRPFSSQAASKASLRSINQNIQCLTQGGVLYSLSVPPPT